MKQNGFAKNLVCLLLVSLLFTGTILAHAAESAPDVPLNDAAPADDPVSQEDIVEQPSLAEQMKLGDMSIDKLLELQALVERELQARGYVIYFDLTRGDKGEEVANLQERLKELGYYSGSISGKYDTETQKAMKQFEKANGLSSDGDASREDQVVLFSKNAVIKSVPNPVPAETAAPKPTMDPALAEYGAFVYEDCARYPEQFYFSKVVLKGTVVQVLGDRKNGFTIRLATANGSSDIVYLLVQFDPGFNILEGDKLTVYAQMFGLKTYETIFGASVTIPMAIADKVELRK